MSKRFFIIGWIALVVTGCNILGDPEEHTILNLDEIYEISLQQDLKPGSNSLVLNIATEKELQCPDASLHVYRTTLSNQLSITINNATEIQGCEPELVQIEKSIATQLDEGSFGIQFIVNSIITDSGTLNIQDDYFQLLLSSFDGIKILNPTLKMVPDNAVWGVLYTQVNGYIDDIENAEDQIHSYLEPVKVDDGKYGYFTFEDNKSEIHHIPAEEIIESRSFLLSTSENLTQILEWKTNLESTYPNVNLDIFHGSYGKL